MPRLFTDYGPYIHGRRNLKVACGFLLILTVGCQGGVAKFPTLSSLNGLNSPTRVPPPAIGSFQVPAGYVDPASGGATSPTTLGQLRAIEQGIPVATTIKPDGWLPTVTDSIEDKVQAANSAFASMSNQPPVQSAGFAQSLSDTTPSTTSQTSIEDDSLRWRKP